MANECGTNIKGCWVYKGFSKTTHKLLYVGTTMQKPSDRFRWHRHNGKDFDFRVVEFFGDDVGAMLDYEVQLIKELKPPMNKKTKRHNDNRRLSKASVEARKGDCEWCQSCLKRRVNAGYNKCRWCS